MAAVKPAPVAPAQTSASGEVRVTVVRRRADPARRQRLVRLLAVVLDKPATPDDGR